MTCFELHFKHSSQTRLKSIESQVIISSFSHWHTLAPIPFTLMTTLLIATTASPSHPNNVTYCDTVPDIFTPPQYLEFYIYLLEHITIEPAFFSFLILFFLHFFSFTIHPGAVQKSLQNSCLIRNNPVCPKRLEIKFRTLEVFSSLKNQMTVKFSTRQIAMKWLWINLYPSRSVLCSWKNISDPLGWPYHE